jgi:hypothetical protein
MRNKSWKWWKISSPERKSEGYLIKLYLCSDSSFAYNALHVCEVPNRSMYLD